MSKDVLGALQVLVTVPIKMIGTLADLLEKLMGPEGEKWFEALKKFLRKEEAWLAVVTDFITATFMVLVDETQTVEEAVKAGNFDWSSGSITSANFPRPVNGQKSEKEVVLFHLGKIVSESVVIAEMDKAGYRPATIWELLGLAKKEPDLQRGFPVVALGSVYGLDGSRHVAFLCGAASYRGLHLRYLGDDFSVHCRFAAVRK